jgi:hypothetical protein
MGELFNQEFQPVTVDHGDLMEVLQSAEAWAGYLRDRGATVKGERYSLAADRIDKAIHNLRKQSLESAK